LPTAPAYGLEPASSSGLPTLLRPPFASNAIPMCRNINLLAIIYAFRPRLGPTNPEKITLTQETLDLRRMGFSPIYRLLVSA